MALILHIETSSSYCSVVLSKGSEIVSAALRDEKHSHAGAVTVLIGQLFQNSSFSLNNLDAVAVSKGPGSYTGLRIGVSVAKGLCFSLDIPLIAVETLMALANGLLINNKDKYISGNALNDVLLCPMIDAKRNEVFSAVYDRQLKQVRETKAEIIDHPADILVPQKRSIIFTGNGAEKLKQVIEKEERFKVIGGIDIKAENMVQIATEMYINKQFEDVAYFEPFYLKDFIAIKPKNKVINSK